MVHRMLRAPDGAMQLVVQGIERVRILEITATEPYLVAKMRTVPGGQTDGLEAAGLHRAVVDIFSRLVPLVGGLNPEAANVVEVLPELEYVANMVAAVSPLDVTVRQELLEMDAVEARLRRLVELLQHEVAVRELGQKIASETQERMSKSQRDYVLRE